MARCVDPEKVRAWRRLMARFANSGLSVAGFCCQEGLSLASFYYWRKRLAQVGWRAPGPYLSNGGISRHCATNNAGARRLNRSTQKGKCSDGQRLARRRKS